MAQFDGTILGASVNCHERKRMIVKTTIRVVNSCVSELPLSCGTIRWYYRWHNSMVFVLLLVQLKGSLGCKTIFLKTFGIYICSISWKSVLNLWLDKGKGSCNGKHRERWYYRVD